MSEQTCILMYIWGVPSSSFGQTSRMLFKLSEFVGFTGRATVAFTFHIFAISSLSPLYFSSFSCLLILTLLSPGIRSIYHHCRLLLFVHHYSARSIGHYQLVSLYLDNRNHLQRFLLFSPWDFQRILCTDVSATLLCTGLFQEHLCTACTSCGWACFTAVEKCVLQKRFLFFLLFLCLIAQPSHPPSLYPSTQRAVSGC